MDLSGELLKMIEARSHPRFVSAVVWSGGVGIISGALLIFGELMRAIWRTAIAAYSWGEAAINGALTFASTATLLREAAVAFVMYAIVLGSVRIIEHIWLGPNAIIPVARLHVAADYLEKLTKNVNAGFELLASRAKEAQARGVDIEGLTDISWSPTTNLQDELRQALARLEKPTKK